MTAPEPLEIFLAAPPGLEPALLAEARAKGFADAKALPGGVTVGGGWDEVRRANLVLRGASRVLARVFEFRAMHLAQLDKRARKLDWAALLRPDVPVRIEATCRKSRIYHDGAAAQRIAGAIQATVGAPIVNTAEETGLRLLARIENDLVTISLDASGEPLHRRGTKEFVGKAPMRETLAALFLAECGFTGTEPVVDPMCGSGTFVLEAAAIAAGLAPGRARAFAFEGLALHDPAAWAAQKAAAEAPRPAPAAPMFHGYDRDDGAIRGAAANAARAGLEAWCGFRRQAVSELSPPPGPPGLVIVNPPYGARIGEKGPLMGLHAALGRALLERFPGWRVGIVTSEPSLARATGLPLLPPGPFVPHGGLKIRLHRTAPLP